MKKKPKHFLDRFALCIGVMSLFTKKLNTTHGLRFPPHNGRTRNRATFRELQPILLTWNDYWKTISIDEAQRLNAWIRRAWRTGVASRGSFFRNRLRPPGLLSKTDVKLKQSGSVGLSPCTCVARAHTYGSRLRHLHTNSGRLSTKLVRICMSAVTESDNFKRACVFNPGTLRANGEKRRHLSLHERRSCNGRNQSRLPSNPIGRRNLSSEIPDVYCGKRNFCFLHLLLWLLVLSRVTEKTPCSDFRPARRLDSAKA